MGFNINNRHSNSPLACWKSHVQRGTKMKGGRRVPNCVPRSSGAAQKGSVKGGGTKKVCLPKAKIASMSQQERQKVVSAKQKAGRAGKYKRSSSSNVTGTASKNLKDWVKQDWRQVGDPSKKCGEK